MRLSDRELIDLLYQVIAREKVKLDMVAGDLGVAPETISRWRKRGLLSRSSRNSIAVYLAGRGVSLSDLTDHACTLADCPARRPVDRQLQIILESWKQLTIEQRGELSTRALVFCNRNEK